MAEQGGNHANGEPQNKESNQKPDKAGRRNTIGGILVGLGAIPPLYMVFFSHDVNVWIAFFSSVAALTGLLFFAIGVIRAKILCIIYIALILAASITTYFLQNTDSGGKVNAGGTRVDTIFVHNEVGESVLRDSVRDLKQKLLKKPKYGDIAKNDIRPIISFFDFSLDTFAVNKPIVISCMVKNFRSGTVAKKVSHILEIEFHSTLDYGDLKFDTNPTQTPQITESPLTLNYRDGKPLSQQWHDLIKSKEWYLYFFGAIYYSDEYNRRDSAGFAVIANPDEPLKFFYNKSKHNFP